MDEQSFKIIVEDSVYLLMEAVERFQKLTENEKNWQVIQNALVRYLYANHEITGEIINTIEERRADLRTEERKRR